jgi:branched-chain amino acid transport system ATP-binding protein
MPMPAASLDIQNLSAGYGPTRIVEGISFNVRAGDRLAVLGRNGMGKTTLLATLMGLTTRHGGAIRIGEQDVTARRTSAR